MSIFLYFTTLVNLFYTTGDKKRNLALRRAKIIKLFALDKAFLKISISYHLTARPSSDSIVDS